MSRDEDGPRRVTCGGIAAAILILGGGIHCDEAPAIVAFDRGANAGPKRYFGILDRHGNTLVQPQYENYRSEVSKDRLLSVAGSVRHTAGVVDVEGRVVVPLQHASTFVVGSGFALVSVTVPGVDEGEEDAEYHGLMKDGVLRCRLGPSLSWHLPGASPERGLFEVLRTTDDGRGFVNDRCEVAITPRFKRVWEFAASGRARVQMPEKPGSRFAGNFGFIDRTGEFVIPPVFSYAVDYQEGLAGVCPSPKGGCGFIDVSGGVVIPLVFQGVSRFSEGAAAVSLDGELWTYIDRTGELLIRDLFERAEPFADGWALVGRPERLRFVNRQGQFMRGRDYRFVSSFACGRALSWSPRTKKYGYLDVRGDYVIAPTWDLADSFSESCYAVVGRLSPPGNRYLYARPLGGSHRWR